MSKILLVNFDEELRKRLAGFLRAERHETFVGGEGECLPAILQRSGGAIDLFILDVSCREKYVRELLAEVISHRAKSGPRPMVLCISRIYRGPRFALDLEMKGARFLYV